MMDARHTQRNLLTDRQLELAFLGLYEQHRNDIGTAATLVQIQLHIFAMASRLEASEQSAKYLLPKEEQL